MLPFALPVVANTAADFVLAHCPVWVDIVGILQTAKTIGLEVMEVAVMTERFEDLKRRLVWEKGIRNGFDLSIC